MLTWISMIKLGQPIHIVLMQVLALQEMAQVFLMRYNLQKPMPQAMLLEPPYHKIEVLIF